MKYRLAHWLQLLAVAVLFVVQSAGAISAQSTDDPNPDSPTPVLLSQESSTFALTGTQGIFPGNGAKKVVAGFRYEPASTAVVYVTNLELLDGEVANAFRVYAEDTAGRVYKFPIIAIRAVKNAPGVYSVKMRIYDDAGFWNEPPRDGEVLISLTWRGLSSNRVKLLLGENGPTIKDDPGAVPTPLSTVQKFSKEPPTTEYVGYRWSGDRSRFMEQAAFGPTTALDQRIRRIGLRTWIAEQFQAPYPKIPYPGFPQMPTNAPVDCDGAADPDPLCSLNHYSMYPMQNWFFKEAFYGDAQLKHRVTWSLSQIWVTSGIETQQSSHAEAYYKVLDRNAFGNWRQLMQEMTLNGAMGNYLDMIRSTRFNPNENYAREVLQLFNIGLFMLNQDGTRKTDLTGNPIPTYDQTTVNNFTNVFTGWSLCSVSGPSCPNLVLGSPNYKDPLIIANTNGHDLTAKTLLNYPGVTNQNVPACAGCTGTAITSYASNSLNQALDNIFYHPNVPPFVSRLLIQHMVTGDPTPAYVGRVAAVFINNGQGVRGDMKSVIKAILLDPEARGNVKTDPYYGKLREPVQLFTNLARHFQVSSADGLSQSDGVVNGFTSNLGQNVFMSPTVFNYYSPEFYIQGTSLKSPEFGIYTTATSVGRLNLGNTFVFSRFNVSVPTRPSGTSFKFTELLPFAQADASGNQLLDELNTRMMHGTMSASMRSTILTAVLAVPSTNPTLRVQQAVYLVATSSQYQVQR